MGPEYVETSFPIPSSMQDLERSPYNLLPYPSDFEDDDEVVRANSFDKLVRLLESGNHALLHTGFALFENPEGEDAGFDDWMDQERMQALYTLVRKSSSLSRSTRASTITSLCTTVHCLCDVLESYGERENIASDERNSTGVASKKSTRVSISSPTTQVLPQSFRDALAFHLYMLFSIMSVAESEAKVGKCIGTIPNQKNSVKNKRKTSKQEKEKAKEIAETASLREACARAMLHASQSMSLHRSKLWRRGVPEESVVSLPCRIAYQMLENSVNITQRKASSGDAALRMIAAIVDSSASLMNTAVAALMDLLHSFEHMPPLVAELCCIVNEVPTNRLAAELLREVGRMDPQVLQGSTGIGGTSGKASGVKNVAPFISELSSRRPKVVLANIGFVLPLLNAEPYPLRSSIATAIGHILVRVKNDEERGEDLDHESGDDAYLNDSENSNLEDAGTKKKTRDDLLDVLTERAHDISSFTRSAVLKAWGNLTENDSLPVDRVLSVTALAIDRLQDKAVMVRRSAMQLLTLLLENNPFMGSLDPRHWRSKISELQQYIETNAPERVKCEMKTAYLIAQQQTNGKSDFDENELKNSTSEEEIQEAALQAAEASENNQVVSEDEVAYNAKIIALRFATSALDFIELFESANDAFEFMLLSSNTSDVTEAIRFFVRARQFNLPFAVTGMKRALALMWSSEGSVKEEVLKGFVDVFIAKPGTGGEELLKGDEIVRNFLALVGTATVSELASIEESIRCLVQKECIPAEVFQLLWSVASKASGEKRAAAMLVISMGASADRHLVDSACRLNLLSEEVLGDFVQENRDWQTVRSAACALQQIGRAQALCPEGSAKYIVLELIIEQLCCVARGDWCKKGDESDTNAWFCAAEQAINAIFVICAEPEKASADILRGLHNSTFGFTSEKCEKVCDPLQLSRFFFVVGHIALKLLVYTEALSGAVNRANAAKSLARQESKDKKKDSSSSDVSDDGSSSIDEDAIESELGVAAEAEAETERNMTDISEKEIVGRGLIGLFGPLLVRVVANEERMFSSDILMQNATLALSKLMCISRTFCERHLPLLFTTLINDPTKDTTLRANAVVTLGDLAFRFPNEVEPYTPRIYACLRDRSNRVRRHALMVLTHLILNDMIKVKGQVCEIALCLEDKDARIKDMSRLFFHELSKRSNNPVYNLLSDIMSQLSQMSVGQDTFRSIMMFLLSFVKKERQNEMLVEKLCQRFPSCSSISQKAAIAFCLAHLRMTEKSLKSLNDQFKCYKDALYDEEVFKWFASIASKAKISAKPEMKECIEEWEAKLANANEIALENYKAGAKAGRANRKAARRRGRRKPARKRSSDGETDESECSQDEVDKENHSPLKRGDEEKESHMEKKGPVRALRQRRVKK